MCSVKTFPLTVYISKNGRLFPRVMLIFGCLVAITVFCDHSESIQTHSFQWVSGRQNSLLASPDLSSPLQAYSLIHCSSICSIKHCKIFFYNEVKVDDAMTVSTAIPTTTTTKAPIIEDD